MLLLFSDGTESAICIVLIESYRGQHWKCKQNKILKKKLKETEVLQDLLYLKNGNLI
jgi:hypothetical protein